MIDLSITTLIIPIKIEHKDRYRNAETVLNFLNSHFQTNVFLYEISPTGESNLDFLDSLTNLNKRHWCTTEKGSFHRTKYLNIMLDEVETPVVANYDIDILLSPNNFLQCQNGIIKGLSKVIYPYELGNGQIMVLDSFDYNGFKKSGYNMNFMNSSSEKIENIAECGHCIFFNTDDYRKYGGENENFISYGPEDKERMYRFQKLTNSVSWKSGEKVYHLEHYRGKDSFITNPHFEENWKIFEYIKKLEKKDLLEYYSFPDYAKNYHNIGKIEL
jgi:hypothetical protein